MTGDDLSSLRADLYSSDRAVRESAVARIVELYDTQTTRLVTEALVPSVDRIPGSGEKTSGKIEETG